MKEKICGFILSAIIIIMLLVAIQFVYQEIQYIEEHPCIETRTQTRCFTHQKCVGGIMAPGFCITEEEVICRQETYCVKRK